MKKYIIAIKLRKEQYERYYYDKGPWHFGFEKEKFWIMSNGDVKYFEFGKIEYFRIIEQGE